ncbi:unnamed protein product, partial [Closterium sp. NIES-53]
QLKARGSRLILVKGDPTIIIPKLVKQWGAKALCFEFDTEPYALARDGKIKASMQEAGVRVVTPVSHTIFDPAKIIKKNGGKPPLTYQAFCKRIGQPSPPIGFAPDKLPPLPSHLAQCATVKAETDLVPGAVEEAGKFDYIEVFEAVPTLSELGYSDAEAFPKEDVTRFQGGETEALRRLDDCLSRTKWVKEFEKPKGDPSALAPPATTVLSPYLKFGCLSSRLMYARIQEVLSKLPGHTKPPVSLIGQLLWREFFYTAAYGTPHFDRMQGSSICRQIPWKVDSELLAAWRDAQTGFPWIDAIMVQLRQWGWMHHLARHCVACFLTRGDLLVHWELGRDVFDRLLVDADWAINNGNWLWLSASAFFSQYHRIYSPVTFGKKYDPSGKFIRHFLPVLKGRREGKKIYGTDGKEVIEEEEENGGVKQRPRDSDYETSQNKKTFETSQKQRQRDSDYETSQNKKGTEEEEGGGEMGRRDATVVVVDGESSMLVLEGLVFYCQGREGRGGRIERGEGGERGEGETSDGEGRGGDGGGRGSHGASFQSFHADVEAPCARVEVDVCARVEVDVCARVEVDVCAWVSLAAAARSDELQDSVDYGEIYSIARRHVESHQPTPLASLALPPLAHTIATTIRTSLPRVKRVWGEVLGGCTAVALPCEESVGATGRSCSRLPARGALCASAPVAALCAFAPVAPLCASAPVAALCASAPVAALCASAPVAALWASAPVAALWASAPVAALRASAPVAARSASAAHTGKLGDGVPHASDKAGLGVDSKAPTGRLGDGVSGASEKAGPLPLSVDSF